MYCGLQVGPRAELGGFITSKSVHCTLVGWLTGHIRGCSPTCLPYIRRPEWMHVCVPDVHCLPVFLAQGEHSTFLSCCKAIQGFQGRSQGAGPFLRSRLSSVTSLALKPE